MDSLLLVLLAVRTPTSMIQYFTAVLKHLIGLSQCATQTATHYQRDSFNISQSYMKTGFSLSTFRFGSSWLSRGIRLLHRIAQISPVHFILLAILKHMQWSGQSCGYIFSFLIGCGSCSWKLQEGRCRQRSKDAGSNSLRLRLL